MTLRKYTNNNNNNVNENAFFSSTSSSKNRYAALDSAASDHYFPASYKGEAHSSGGVTVPVRTANNSIMRSVATDCFPAGNIPAAARLCKKFVEIQIPLVSVLYPRPCSHL